jgi:FkbH-like protein
VQVRDRFGDYGLVGTVLFERRAEHLWVDTLLLSCRVLGRKVEHRMLEKLGQVAQARGLQWVHVPYCSTHKNQPVLDFLNELGDEFRHPSNDGYCFQFPTEKLLGLNESREASITQQSS